MTQQIVVQRRSNQLLIWGTIFLELAMDQEHGQINSTKPEGFTAIRLDLLNDWPFPLNFVTCNFQAYTVTIWKEGKSAFE